MPLPTPASPPTHPTQPRLSSHPLHPPPPPLAPQLWSANYDRAMTAYLACLREFGEFARRKDLQDGELGGGGGVMVWVVEGWVGGWVGGWGGWVM